MKNKKVLLKDIKIQTNIAVISIIMIVISIIGSSYAAFVWNAESSENQSMTSGNYVIEIDNSSSSTITLDSVYPMTKEDGLATEPYTFTIKNNSNTDVEFSLKLEKDTTLTNTLNTSEIALNLSVGSAKVEQISAALLAALPDNELDSGILPSNTSKTYNLKLWLKEDATNDAIGKTFNGKLTLDTNQVKITGNDYQLGDVNMNGIIDIMDSNYAYFNWYKSLGLTSEQKKLADYDGDGTVKPTDVNSIFQLYKQNSNLLSSKISSNTSNISPSFTTDSTDNDVFIQVGDGTRTKNGFPVMYYRGAVTNNYVSFAGILWRIVRINEDGTVKLITQNNITEDGINYNNTGDGTIPNYEGSDIKQVVDEWYNANIGNNKEFDSKVVITEFNNYTLSEEVNYRTKELLRIEYENFIHPTFKNSNESIIIKSKVGLLTTDEIAFAGGLFGKTVTNNTTYLDNENSFWSMSGLKVSPTTKKGMVGWWVSSEYVDPYKTGIIATTLISIHVRPVITLRADVTVSDGDGSIGTPFVIE